MPDVARPSALPPVAQSGAAGRFIIRGVTLGGRPFRPSDWAQRLATAVGGHDRRGRVRFHPLVRVVISDGIASVVVDGALARTEPALYAFLRNFGSSNELQIADC